MFEIILEYQTILKCPSLPFLSSFQPISFSW